jgi:phage terminase small subunit
LCDLNATQAAIRAGYAPGSADVTGARLLGNARIAAAVQEARAALSERTQITQDWVLTTLVENVERAMQAEPVRDREGEPTGEYTYQGSVANKALELIGKHLGMFKDEVKHSGSVLFQLDIPRPEPYVPQLPAGDEDDDG